MYHVGLMSLLQHVFRPHVDMFEDIFVFFLKKNKKTKKHNYLIEISYNDVYLLSLKFHIEPGLASRLAVMSQNPA